MGCHSRYSKRFACRCVLRGCGVAVCGYYYLGRMRYGYISACAASLSRQDALRLLSRHARAAATISACAGRGCYLGMRGPQATISTSISACAGRSCCPGMRGPQLLSRRARAAATIPASAGRSYYLGMRGPQLLSRHARAAAYYLGAGCPAAISAWAEPQLLSRQAAPHYLGMRVARVSASATMSRLDLARRWRRRRGNTFVCSRRRHSTARRGAARLAGCQERSRSPSRLLSDGCSKQGSVRWSTSRESP